MSSKYADISPSDPLLNSDAKERPSAAALMSVRYFKAEPDRMLEAVFDEHHVLLNLNEHPHRVQNRRNGVMHDFVFQQDEIVITPARTRSGWRWFAPSDVIVVTLEPMKLERFAQSELGLLLASSQLSDSVQASDQDLCIAGRALRDALAGDDMPSAVMFGAMSRVFLVKLLQRYGQLHRDAMSRTGRFTAQHYQAVLTYVQDRMEQTITVDALARHVGMSPSHFSRVFKETMSTTPMQFVMAYRIEQAVSMMGAASRPLGDIALACGFADQAHFTRSFKQIMGQTPRAYRAMYAR